MAADDDVFDQGCGSLTALRLTGRIEAVLDRVVDVGPVFRCRTARARSHALTPLSPGSLGDGPPAASAIRPVLRPDVTGSRATRSFCSGRRWSSPRSVWAA
ncbi:acyl carrier protein [Streptomyces sp. NPDC093272]|uniref:acyl carrier protein n=1 Tax=Streptomyces sp. NPDC093272 TaxID=3154981 RepID=UPI0034440C1A